MALHSAGLLALSHFILKLSMPFSPTWASWQRSMLHGPALSRATHSVTPHTQAEHALRLNWTSLPEKHASWPCTQQGYLLCHTSHSSWAIICPLPEILGRACFIADCRLPAWLWQIHEPGADECGRRLHSHDTCTTSLHSHGSWACWPTATTHVCFLPHGRWVQTPVLTLHALCHYDTTIVIVVMLKAKTGPYAQSFEDCT